MPEFLYFLAGAAVALFGVLVGMALATMNKDKS